MQGSIMNNPSSSSVSSSGGKFNPTRLGYEERRLPRFGWGWAEEEILNASGHERVDFEKSSSVRRATLQSKKAPEVQKASELPRHLKEHQEVNVVVWQIAQDAYSRIYELVYPSEAFLLLLPLSSGSAVDNIRNSCLDVLVREFLSGICCLKGLVVEARGLSWAGILWDSCQTSRKHLDLLSVFKGDDENVVIFYPLTDDMWKDKDPRVIRDGRQFVGNKAKVEKEYRVKAGAIFEEVSQQVLGIRSFTRPCEVCHESGSYSAFPHGSTELDSHFTGVTQGEQTHRKGEWCGPKLGDERLSNAELTQKRAEIEGRYKSMFDTRSTKYSVDFVYCYAVVRFPKSSPAPEQVEMKDSQLPKIARPIPLTDTAPKPAGRGMSKVPFPPMEKSKARLTPSTFPSRFPPSNRSPAISFKQCEDSQLPKKPWQTSTMQVYNDDSKASSSGNAKATGTSSTFNTSYTSDVHFKSSFTASSRVNSFDAKKQPRSDDSERDPGRISFGHRTGSPSPISPLSPKPRRPLPSPSGPLPFTTSFGTRASPRASPEPIPARPSGDHSPSNLNGSNSHFYSWASDNGSNSEKIVGHKEEKNLHQQPSKLRQEILQKERQYFYVIRRAKNGGKATNSDDNAFQEYWEGEEQKRKAWFSEKGIEGEGDNTEAEGYREAWVEWYRVWNERREIKMEESSKRNGKRNLHSNQDSSLNIPQGPRKHKKPSKLRQEILQKEKEHFYVSRRAKNRGKTTNSDDNAFQEYWEGEEQKRKAWFSEKGIEGEGDNTEAEGYREAWVEWHRVWNERRKIKM